MCRRFQLIKVKLTPLQNAAKLGLAVAIEAADEAVMEQQEQPGANVSAGAIPF